MTKKVVGAGAFKQGCLALLDEVAEGKAEVVVTKRGRAVARLVPIVSPEQREAEILGGLRGKGRLLVKESEFLRPSSDDEPWSAVDGDRVLDGDR